ncbi:MAG: hypothetical protein HZC38_01810 [Chloroflexi bacterium]|nr:hypothetical protein [Chloroflexota bacterium]
MAILSGMCTGLNPDFNLFIGLAPFAQTLLTEETGGEGLDFWLNEAVEIGRKLLALPARIDGALNRIERGEFTMISKPSPEQKQQTQLIASALNRLTGGMIVAALIVAGTTLVVNGNWELGIGGWGIGLLVLVWMMVRER